MCYDEHLYRIVMVCMFRRQRNRETFYDITIHLYFGVYVIPGGLIQQRIALLDHGVAAYLFGSL